MRKHIIYISSVIVLLSPVSGNALSFSDSRPGDGESFRATSITCSVLADGLPPGGTFYFFHASDLLFTSSTTMKLVLNRDYRMYTTSAAVSFTYTGFDEGSDNYYAWGYNQEKSNSIYTINVLENKAPSVTVIQPDHNGFSGTKPIFEIAVADEGEGIDESSIVLTLVDASGSPLFSSTGNGAGMYDSVLGKITCVYPGVISPGVTCTFSVSVTDRGYRAPYAETTTKTVQFNACSGGIADIVPVPSPFDPGKEQCAIQYTLRDASNDVEINIYDMSSRMVRNVVRGASRAAGENTVDTWDGKDFAGQNLANGVYFIELITDSDKRYTSVIVMRK